jgi:hypothetical protein
VKPRRRNRDARVIAMRTSGKKMAWLLLAGTLLLAAAAVQASDRSIRCGKHLLYAGGGSNAALQYEVLKKCGQPAAQSGDSWVYYQGNMVRHLTFNHQGRLLRIESQRK